MLHFSRDDESSHKLGSNSDHFSAKQMEEEEVTGLMQLASS